MGGGPIFRSGPLFAEVWYVILMVHCKKIRSGLLDIKMCSFLGSTVQVLYQNL